VFLLSACEYKAVSLQKEIAELRFEQQGALDKLRKKYGQGELATALSHQATTAGEKQAKAQADKTDAAVTKKLYEAISSTVLDVDKNSFESHCVDIGKGERPTIFSPRARAFFDSSEAKGACRDVAVRHFSIVAKEAELQRALAGQ